MFINLLKNCIDNNMKKVVLLLVLFFVSGCMVGPNYKKPDISLSESFVESSFSENSMDSIVGWWENFNDPKLNELIKLGISNNYSFKIALEKIEETRAFYRIKRADLFPEIDATAAAIRTGVSNNLVQTSFLPVSTYNNFQIGFDALWEIDLFGKLRREKESAYYQIQAQQESMRNVYVSLISDIAKNYMDMIALNNYIELTNKKIMLQNIILELIKNKTQNGIDSDIEKENEIAKLQEEKEKLQIYLTLSKQTLYRLAVLLGQQSEDINSEYFNLMVLPKAENKINAGMPSTLLRRRPDIRVAERELAKATSEVASAIADYFPRFSLVGDSNFKTSPLNKLFNGSSFSWSLGSIMKWPIINFGRIKANVDVKKSVQNQALLFYENTVLEALKDVESALAAYFNEMEKLKNIQTQLHSIEKITLLEKSKYESGLINYPNYLEQEKSYIDIMIKEIDSRRTLAVNLIALYKALGGGDWEE